MIDILIAEDQAMILGALTALLELEPDLRIVGKVNDGREALNFLSQNSPDIVLTDIEMPGLDGLELASNIRERCLKCRVIILTTFANSSYLRRALNAGVAGYLLKAAPAEALAQAIRTIHSGGRVIDPELAVASWGEDTPLNERERQALQLAVKGYTAREIAERLNLSEGTVRNYMSEAISKLGATNRIEAARIACEKGWL